MPPITRLTPNYREEGALVTPHYISRKRFYKNITRKNVTNLICRQIAPGKESRVEIRWSRVSVRNANQSGVRLEAEFDGIVEKRRGGK